MSSVKNTARTALFLSTAMLMMPNAGPAAELSYIETDELTVGSQVFLPDAVAFSANGVEVRCSEIAFHIARTRPECFAVLTEEDLVMIREAARAGRTFTTASGFTFSPGPSGSIVGVTESGQSFAVSGSPTGVSSGSQMDEDALAGFLGLESAEQLGGAQVGLEGSGSTGATGGGISVGIASETTASGSGVSVGASGEGEAGGTSAGVSAGAEAGDGVSAGVSGEGGTGGTSAGVSAGAEAGSGGVSAGVSGEGETGGTSAGVSAGAEAGSGGVSAGVSGEGETGGTSASTSGGAEAGSGISAGVGAEASVGGVSAGAGAGATVGGGGGISAGGGAGAGTGGIGD